MNALNRTKLLYAAVIAAMVVFTFLPSLGGEILNWDDETHVTENPAVQKFDLKLMFTQTVQKVYIPLTSFSFSVEKKVFDNNPFVYHLTNLLLHLTNTLLVFFFIQRLGVTARVAFWAALLFGIHPMRVESVAWITERKDLLYAFFYLLALFQYIRYIDGKKAVHYWRSILFGVLSLLAKPMALSLPLVLYLLDWFKGRKFDRCAILEKIPFFLYVIPITLVTYTHHVRNPIGDIVQALLTWTWTFNFYLWKFVWPKTLVPVYHLPEPIVLNNPLYLVSLLFFVVFIGFTIRLKSKRWWLFSVGFYFLSIFFLLRFDTTSDINIVADRFMYLPSVGFCVLFGLGVEKVVGLSAEKRVGSGKALLWIVFTAMLLLSFKSIDQIKVWNNSITLWTYVIKHNPTEFLAYNDRAVAYIRKGFYDLGIRDYTSILEFHPGHEDAYFNRGLAYEKIGRYRAAIDDFNEVTKKFPSYEKAYLHRGICYEAMGDLPAAFDEYSRTIQVSPMFPDGYLHRGNIFNHQDQLDHALADYDRVIELSPRHDRAFNNRGIVFAKLSRNDNAIQNFTTAVAINPGFGEAYFNRSLIYLRINKKAEALADAIKAQKLGIPVPAGYIEGLR